MPDRRVWGILALSLCVVLWAGQHNSTDAQTERADAQKEQNLSPSSPNTSFLKDFPGKIVFQSDRDGDWEIYVMNADGSNLVQLTNHPAADEYPVWSPDGQQIAFKSNRDGNWEIYVMKADGTEPRRLTDHPSNDEDPAWSPDGKQIAFHSGRVSNQEVYVMNADGSGLTQITSGFGKNVLAAWSPDGKYLAYTGNRYLGWNVYVLNLQTSEDNRITDGHGACRPDWSPDGKKIAYVSQKGDGKGDIWVMNPDGSEKTRLTLDDVNYDYYPAWSPDGKYVAYAKSPDKEQGNWELYVMTADGTLHVPLTQHPARDKFPDWAAGRVPKEWMERRTFVYEAESSPHQVGAPREDADASEGYAIYAAASEGRGFLTYGPYTSYPPAEYLVSFWLKTDQIELQHPIVAIDVATDTGTTILAKQEIKGEDFQSNNRYQKFQLAWSLQESKELEFRVYSFGAAVVWVDKVTVVQKQP